MEVLFDHQIFSAQTYGGISRYHIELIRHLNRLDNTSCHLSCLFTNNENLLDSKLFPVRPFFEKVSFKGKRRLIEAINRRYSKKILRESRFDVFHPTFYDDYFLKILSKKPFVITCHDLIVEKIYGASKGRAETGKAAVLRKAGKIIAVSENTKNDIVEHYKIEPSKIEVVYLAHEQADRVQQPNVFLPPNYFLFVGLRQGYKNFSGFARAISFVLKKYPDLYLVCAGGNKFTKEEQQLLASLGIFDKVLFRDIDRNNLNHIYGNAVAFFFPSLYEGFGIPVLEAFHNSCPVVVSDRGSLPEIAKDAALYFQPLDQESIIAAAVKILEDNFLRQTLIERGHARLKDFSWKKTAVLTRDIYQRLI